MTIGQALKKERKKLGLSQMQMAAGIISRAQYGKVENDIHDISAKKLIELLNRHNIDVNNFFAGLSDSSTKEIRQSSFIHDLKEAFFSQDTLKLDQLLNASEKLHLSQDLQYQVILPKAMLAQNMENIPTEVKHYLQSRLFEKENWTEDAMLLSFFGNAMMILSPDYLDLHIAQIFKKYKQINQFPLFMQNLIASIGLNYLFYTHSRPNSALWAECFKIIELLSPDPSLFEYRLVSLYFKAYSAHNDTQLQLIKYLLQESGESRLLTLLPK